MVRSRAPPWKRRTSQIKPKRSLLNHHQSKSKMTYWTLIVKWIRSQNTNPSFNMIVLVVVYRLDPFRSPKKEKDKKAPPADYPAFSFKVDIDMLNVERGTWPPSKTFAHYSWTCSQISMPSTWKNFDDLHALPVFEIQSWNRRQSNQFNFSPQHYHLPILILPSCM